MNVVLFFSFVSLFLSVTATTATAATVVTGVASLVLWSATMQSLGVAEGANIRHRTTPQIDKSSFPVVAAAAHTHQEPTAREWGRVDTVEEEEEQELEPYFRFLVPSSMSSMPDDAPIPSASFGSGIEVFGKTNSTRYPINGQISWVVELNGIGLGLCDSTRHEFHVWNTVNGAGIDNLRSVALAPLSNPVGAIHSHVEPHLVYIACFGTWPTPIQADSGIAIVDISNSEQPVLVRTVAYPDPRMHVHNVYEFDFVQGPGGGAVVSEITVAVIGNPWLVPALPGHGLVQLDRHTGNFRPLIGDEKEGGDMNRLNVRSAKQAAPGIFYAVTQEPAGVATQVVRLEQTTPKANIPHELKIVARSVLPTRNGGDGGADVILGLQPNTVWVSDRWNQAGRLYYYKYHLSSTTAGDGTFERVAMHVATGGNGARYTMITHTGDIMVCNDGRTDPVPGRRHAACDSGTLTVMTGLALNPQSNSEVVTIDTVLAVQFFLESKLLPSSSVANDCSIASFPLTSKYQNCHDVEYTVDIECAPRHTCTFTERYVNDIGEECIIQGSFDPIAQIGTDPARPGVCLLEFISLKDSCIVDDLGFGMKAEVDMSAGHANNDDACTSSLMLLQFSTDGGSSYYSEDKPRKAIALDCAFPTPPKRNLREPNYSQGFC